ncbi:hypothetical protein JXO59_15300 [candidate division KSB1 bacterium]|nr:hypothetical protein [candidate division KSB1 bacterium]
MGIKMNLVAEKIERHRAFLHRQNADRPLFGCVYGWENVNRYTGDPAGFFPAGEVHFDDISCERFRPMYRSYAGKLDDSDDWLATLEPLPFFPWCEAAAGCAVKYTGKNFWSSRTIDDLSDERLAELVHRFRDRLKSLRESLTDRIEKPPRAAATWPEKYGDFIDYLTEYFGDRHPIGQTILRGPLDIAAAVMGEEAMILQMFQQPSLMTEFLELAGELFMLFIDVQTRYMHSFAGGFVIGTYYVWTPARNIRMQEDAMALLSPDMYRRFAHPVDCAIAAAAGWTLFHIHAAGLHHLDALLLNDGINIFQVSKDEGVELSAILPQLLKIQRAQKCLLLKGRLNRDDLHLIKSNLHPAGLGLQAVVLDENEAEEMRLFIDVNY